MQTQIHKCIFVAIVWIMAEKQNETPARSVHVRYVLIPCIVLFKGPVRRIVWHPVVRLQITATAKIPLPHPTLPQAAKNCERSSL